MIRTNIHCCLTLRLIVGKKGRTLKRFYEKVTVEKAEDYFTVALDGRSMRTPGMNALSLTTEKLANLSLIHISEPTRPY